MGHLDGLTPLACSSVSHLPTDGARLCGPAESATLQPDCAFKSRCDSRLGGVRAVRHAAGVACGSGRRRGGSSGQVDRPGPGSAEVGLGSRSCRFHPAGRADEPPHGRSQSLRPLFGSAKIPAARPSWSRCGSRLGGVRAVRRAAGVASGSGRRRGRSSVRLTALDLDQPALGSAAGPAGSVRQAGRTSLPTDESDPERIRRRRRAPSPPRRSLR